MKDVCGSKAFVIVFRGTKLVQARAKAKKNLFFIGLCRAQPNLRSRRKLVQDERNAKKNLFFIGLCRAQPNLRSRRKLVQGERNAKKNLFLLTSPPFSAARLIQASLSFPSVSKKSIFDVEKKKREAFRPLFFVLQGVTGLRSAFPVPISGKTRLIFRAIFPPFRRSVPPP